MKFFANVVLNRDAGRKYEVGTLAAEISGGNGYKYLGDPSFGTYGAVLFIKGVVGGQALTEFISVWVGDPVTMTYLVARDISNIYHSPADTPTWPAGTPYFRFTYEEYVSGTGRLIGDIPGDSDLAVATGTLSQDVAADYVFYSSLHITPGFYLKLSGYLSDGSYLTELVRVSYEKTEGSGMVGYRCVRDVLGQYTALSLPAWRAGDSFEVYPNAVVGTPETLIGNFEVANRSRFSTQLHGGFSDCSFVMSGSRDQNFARLDAMLGASVKIFDQLGRQAWEGFVTETSVNNTSSELEVSAAGYYAKADTRFFDMIYQDIEDTVNLVTNPSFGSGLLNWNTNGMSSEANFSFTGGLFGAYCLKLNQAVSVQPFSVWASIAVESGKYYTLSFYVKGYHGTNQAVNMDVYVNGVGITFIDTAVPGIDGTWRRFELPAFKPNSFAITLGFRIPGIALSANQTVYIDGVQLEQKPYATPYCDGNQAGCTWSGTPDASTSSRVAVISETAVGMADCIGMIPEWYNGSAFFNACNISMGSLDFSGKKVKDAIEELMKLGINVTNSADEEEARSVYFAIWENRIPRLVIEPTPNDLDRTPPEWLLSVNNIVNKMGVTLNMADVYNKVYSYYSDQNYGPTPTIPSSDYYSQYRYGVREGFLENGDIPYTQTKSLFLQEAALQRYKYPRMVMQLDIAGFVKHISGRMGYPYQIRAGQVIQVVDMDASVVSAYGMFGGQAAYRATGFVLKTDYDAKSGAVRLTIGSSDESFEVLMGRLGLRGGLS